jgi:hypothetical protein
MKWLLLVITLGSWATYARDTKYLLKISDVLMMPEAAGRLDPSVKLFFGTQPAPEGEEHGKVVANPKTNSLNQKDEEACRWMMLSGLVELQKRAKAMGATAIVGIESNYKKQPFSSETEFECHAGPLVTGVSLRGEMIK